MQEALFTHNYTVIHINNLFIDKIKLFTFFCNLGDDLENPTVHFNNSNVYTTGESIQFKIITETNVVHSSITAETNLTDSNRSAINES